jgi:hypothetical protein
LTGGGGARVSAFELQEIGNSQEEEDEEADFCLAPSGLPDAKCITHY